jgi:hypothetical protein
MRCAANQFVQVPKQETGDERVPHRLIRFGEVLRHHEDSTPWMATDELRFIRAARDASLLPAVAPQWQPQQQPPAPPLVRDGRWRG